MANQYVRLNLASAIFPFYTEAAGRTIMVPNQDENFDRYNAANTTPDKGVPQVFYMHNVVPISGGFQSIGYIEELSGLSGNTDFDTCFSLIDSDLSSYLFCPAAGKNYIYDGNNSGWVSTNPLASGTVPDNVLVTRAYVKGVTYIYYSGIGCYMYNGTTQQFVSVTLSGLTPSGIIGICEANGYMIAWSTSAVYWSSLTDPTNFIPSIVTGAGGGAIQDAKGAINFCTGISGGFLVYCSKNIVGASYTANTNYPYIIQEIPGSGGVATIDNVAYQGNLSYQLALTTAGLQQVSLTNAVPTMPELSDFIEAQLFEDFDETSLSFSYQFISSQLSVKLASIAEKFIVISYGMNPPNYTHAIIYDIALNRYGKLKLPHRSCFSYVDPVPHGLITYSDLAHTTIAQLAESTYKSLFSTLQTEQLAKQNLAFMQQDGTVQLVDFELSEQYADGVFIIGKLQFQRNQFFVHQRTDVETINSNSAFSLSLLGTFDGKDFQTAVPTVAIETNQLMRRYAKRYTASNVSLCIVGAFNLTSIVVNFTVGGYR